MGGLNKPRVSCSCCYFLRAVANNVIEIIAMMIVGIVDCTTCAPVFGGLIVGFLVLVPVGTPEGLGVALEAITASACIALWSEA